MRSSVAGAAVALALSVGIIHPMPAAAAGGYRQFNLTSNVPGGAQHRDTNLVNAWGVAFFPGNPFWVSDEGTGLSTLYDSHGAPQGLVVTVPAAPEAPSGTLGSPTGIVANATAGFSVSKNGASGPGFFLFATLDGTISGWNPGVDPTHAVIAVDNFPSHALYTGLEIAKTQKGPRLYAADAVNNRIDVFDTKFRKLFSFTDVRAPKNMSVYGVHLVDGRIAVTYASQANNAGGVVDIFDFDGRLVRTFAKNGPGGPLDSPWAVVQATANFGKFSNAILVGNEDDGKISAFDRNSGAFLGQLTDTQGNTIAIPGLWDLTFGIGGGASGNRDELFFSAGPNGYGDGLFGKFVAAP